MQAVPVYRLLKTEEYSIMKSALNIFLLAPRGEARDEIWQLACFSDFKPSTAGILFTLMRP